MSNRNLSALTFLLLISLLFSYLHDGKTHDTVVFQKFKQNLDKATQVDLALQPSFETIKDPKSSEFRSINFRNH